MKKQKNILRILFVANILWAGIPGSVMVLAPDWAKANMYTWPVDDFLFGITGSIWMAIGLISIIGLQFPLQLAPLFLVQMVYKLIWIFAVGIPLGNSGLIDAWYYVGGFAFIIVIFGQVSLTRQFFKTKHFLHNHDPGNQKRQRAGYKDFNPLFSKRSPR